MKLVFTKICFILQNIVSAFLCFSCMWLIAYIPMFPIVIENSIAEIKNQPFAIFSFLASLIVGGGISDISCYLFYHALYYMEKQENYPLIIYSNCTNSYLCCTLYFCLLPKINCKVAIYHLGYRF